MPRQLRNDFGKAFREPLVEAARRLVGRELTGGRTRAAVAPQEALQKASADALSRKGGAQHGKKTDTWCPPRSVARTGDVGCDRIEQRSRPCRRHAQRLSGRWLHRRDRLGETP